MKFPRSPFLAVLCMTALTWAACTAGDGAGLPSVSPGSGTVDPVAGGPVMAEPYRDPVPGQARLIRGSEAVRGITGFGRNAIPALYAQYALLSAEGEPLLVSVWYTRETLILGEGWSPGSCPGLPAGFSLSRSETVEPGFLVLVASTGEYRLVFRLPPGFGNPCRFIAVLIERFRFFLVNAARVEDLSFPAFLQL